MSFRIAGAVFLVGCAVQVGRADLTMRHTFTIKFASFVPPQIVDSMKQFGNRLADGITVQIRGDRVCASMAHMFAVTDYAKGETTLVDPATKRFATVPLAEYRAVMLARQIRPRMPDAQRAWDNMKLEVKTSKTGRTETIHGIRTEEKLLVMSMELMAGIHMRTELYTWSAGVDELQRTPALRDLAVYAARPKGALDPAEMVTMQLAGMPGMGEKLGGPMEEMMKAAGFAIIRMREVLYMPPLTQALGRGAAAKPAMELEMDLAELSVAPVADSQFEVPAGYRRAPMEDVRRAFDDEPKAEIPSGGTVRIPAEDSAGRNRLYKVGNGVSAPQVVEHPEPSYTEAARAAKLQGTVLLEVVVRPDGTAGQIQVLRSLDRGLDQKAVEAVSKWKFKPGMKDGHPVAVQGSIEVNFRLVD